MPRPIRPSCGRSAGRPALVAGILALGLAVLAARPAFADGDPPRIGLDPARVAAGGSLTVHGIDFADAGPVSIVLVDADGAGTRIGNATADDHGGFMIAVAIPVTTVPGAFVVRAIPAGGEPVDGAITVGPPIPEPGEQRGADEPLLAPMPSGGPLVAPDVAAPSGIPATPGAPAPQSVGSAAIALAVLVVLVVGGAVIGMVALLRRRPDRSIGS